MLRSPDQKKKKERGKRTTPLFHNIKSLTAKTNKPKKKKKTKKEKEKYYYAIIFKMENFTRHLSFTNIVLPY